MNLTKKKKALIRITFECLQKCELIWKMCALGTRWLKDLFNQVLVEWIMPED